MIAEEEAEAINMTCLVYESMMNLPARVTFGDGDGHPGHVILINRRTEAYCCLERGLYRCVLNGRLVVVGVGPRVRSGHAQRATIYRPIFRVPALRGPACG